MYIAALRAHESCDETTEQYKRYNEHDEIELRYGVERYSACVQRTRLR